MTTLRSSLSSALGFGCISLTLALTLPSSGNTDDPLGKIIDQRFEEVREELVEVRRDLHRHPEVSGQEQRTSGIVASRLRNLGFEVTTDVGGHGVVGVLVGELPGPVVAFRADMDAVLSGAPDPVDFKSEVPGVRHICGHDIHTTVGLALAEGFAAVRETLPGTLMLVFQPAEENATGARAMLADGVFTSLKPQAIYALHTAPLPTGQVATMPGGMMASRDRLTVRIRGDGDLSLASTKVRDAVLAIGTISGAAAFGEASDPDFVLVQVAGTRAGEEQGGSVFSAVLTSASDTGRRIAKSGVERALAAISVPDVTFEHEYMERWVAGVSNDSVLTSQAISSARSKLGADSVIDLTTVVPAFSEDFGSFQAEVPGVMFFLGVSNAEKGIVGMPHSPTYAADEDSIVVGAGVMATILLDRFHDVGPSP